jgi:hypothetical protein
VLRVRRISFLPAAPYRPDRAAFDSIIDNFRVMKPKDFQVQAWAGNRFPDSGAAA